MFIITYANLYGCEFLTSRKNIYHWCHRKIMVENTFENVHIWNFNQFVSQKKTTPNVFCKKTKNSVCIIGPDMLATKRQIYLGQNTPEKKTTFGNMNHKLVYLIRKKKTGKSYANNRNDAKNLVLTGTMFHNIK